MVQDSLKVVRGKQIVPIDGETFRREATRFSRVIVDLGAGDGRWVYRLARGHPGWLCVAVDANARQMRDVSFRSRRKPDRGGTANAWYLFERVETLPGPLRHIADEIHVNFPWGSLLRAVLTPDPLVLLRIAEIGRPGATLAVQINASLFNGPDVSAGVDLAPGGADATSRLCKGYASAGIQLIEAGGALGGPKTSWNRRLSRGRPRPVFSLRGIIVASGDSTSRSAFSSTA